MKRYFDEKKNKIIGNVLNTTLSNNNIAFQQINR